MQWAALETRGSHECCCGKRQRNPTASSEACSRGSCSRLTKGRLLQEADDYDKRCFSNDCGMHTAHAKLRVQLGPGNPGTVPKEYDRRNHRRREGQRKCLEP